MQTLLYMDITLGMKRSHINYEYYTCFEANFWPDIMHSCTLPLPPLPSLWLLQVISTSASEQPNVSPVISVSFCSHVVYVQCAMSYNIQCEPLTVLLILHGHL